MSLPPPRTEEELLTRAHAIAGRTVGEVAGRVRMPVPDSTLRAKGFVGQLIEKALGASAGSRGEPDFVEIGVELKTLPVGANGRPRESTFVASLPLTSLAEIDFEDSFVAKKLARVLWVPIEAERSIPLPQRRIGGAIVWSPSADQERVLREDYERIAGLVLEGDHESITGHLGTYLQVRPKAANSAVKGMVMDRDGHYAWTGPRGFYLRPDFTATLLAGRL